MRKINLVVVLFIALLSFTACNKDDDNDGTNLELSETNLIGKWTWVAGMEDGKNIELDECDKMDFYDFKTNNIVDEKIHFSSNTTDSQGNTVIECLTDVEDTGTWKLNGTTLELTIDGESFTEKIINFTGDEFTFDYGAGNSDTYRRAN